MTKSIRHQLYLPHSPEVIWEYLTTAEHIANWLMKNDFKPVKGHEFQFWTQPLPQFNFDGNVYCKVLELIPLRKLSYSWKGGPAKGQVTLDSIVEWTLTPRGEGTELRLEHSGFPEEFAPMFSVMEKGWLEHMHRINERINAAIHDTTQS